MTKQTNTVYLRSFIERSCGPFVLNSNLIFHWNKAKLQMLRKPTQWERGRKKQTPRTRCVVKPVDTNPTLVLQHPTWDRTETTIETNFWATKTKIFFSSKPACLYSHYSQGSEDKKNQIVPSKPKKQRVRLKRATNGLLKFDKVGCQELDPKVLLYNRIFKTGSSTTESIITNSSSSMNYGYKIGEIRAKSPAEKDRKKIF